MHITHSFNLPRVALLIIGALCIIQTLVAFFCSTYNIGVIFPAILGLPLLLWGIFYPNVQPYLSHGPGHVLKIIVLIGYTLFLLSFIVISIMIFNAAHKKAPPSSDAIIVLGAGLKGENVSKILAKRLDQAIDYLTYFPDTVVVVSGGQGQGEVRSEASAMADYLTIHGIAPEKILQENQSTSTRENFKFSKEILDNYFSDQPYTAVFVTSGFHVWRAELIAKKNNWPIQGIASPYDIILAPNYYSREYIAIIHHWITKNI